METSDGVKKEWRKEEPWRRWQKWRRTQQKGQFPLFKMAFMFKHDFGSLVMVVSLLT
jgi:hypothetical protein